MHRILLCSIILLAASAQERPLALQGLDPVELTAGREVKGSASLTAERGKFRYAFATEANRSSFLAEADRFAIQMGGACARMGPLSGTGSPDRFQVVDGRIYIFASDACRNTFRTDPAKFIDTPDEEPEGSAELGASLLRKAVEAMGGEDLLRQLSTMQIDYQITSRSGEREYKYKRMAATVFPQSFAQIDDYGSSKGGWVLDNDSSVEPQVRQFMIRSFYRHPVHILHAWLHGRAKAAHTGRDQFGERVAVAVQGATTTLWIDASRGRIMRAAYRARTGNGIANIEREFSDFRVINGLSLPFAVKSRVNGEPSENPAVEVESIRINEKIDPALFRRQG